MEKYSCQTTWITWNHGGGPEVIQIFKLNLNDDNWFDSNEWAVTPGGPDAQPIFTIGSEPKFFTDPLRPKLHVYRKEMFDNITDCVNNAIYRIFTGKF